MRPASWAPGVKLRGDERRAQAPCVTLTSSASLPLGGSPSVSRAGRVLTTANASAPRESPPSWPPKAVCGADGPDVLIPRPPSCSRRGTGEGWTGRHSLGPLGNISRSGPFQKAPPPGACWTIGYEGDLILLIKTLFTTT